MTAGSGWIPTTLKLTSGIEIILGVDHVVIRDKNTDGGSAADVGTARFDPNTAAEAAEMSIALKRAQRRMDQIWRDKRAEDDAKR